VAQSPRESRELDADSEYLKSWDALGALLAQGKSFSGRERDCAFLNVGVIAKIPSFACASGAINLDQTDDSRAIIPADWDGDGDLDLWYANRTAPRLRFFRNDIVAGSHWLALDLEGRTCNRDAIGARAELTLSAPDGSRRTLWRRLRAGDAFLSQTPKTLHFGFRGDEKVERLVIRWPAPGLPEQVVTGIQADRRWRITEGSGAQVSETARLSLAAGPAALPEETAQTRTVLVNRMAVPKLEFVDFQARAQSIGGSEPGQPVLLLLWGSWCPRCRAEMTDLVRHAAELTAKNVRVIALSVDAASPEPEADGVTAAKRAIEALQWPFESGVAAAGAVRALAILESKALYPERPLPLPTAYLLDPSGKMAVIYHGPVGPAQIAQDADLAAEPPKEPESVSFPFPGRSAKRLFRITMTANVQALREGGYLDDARSELQKQIEKVPATDAASASALWAQLADVQEESGRTDDAIDAWKQAIALAPERPELHLACAASLWKAKRTAEADAAFAKAAQLSNGAAAFQNQSGKVWQRLGEHHKAREAFAAAVAAAPDDIEARFNLAVARQLGGDTAGAIADYESVLQSKSDLLDAASNLAWVLATAKDETLRQPARALTIAGEVNKSSGGQSPAVLDNLAAARAATGDFDGACAAAREALTLAIATGESALAADIKKHLAAFQQRHPWIE
jgi:tetratricopeptide (TPR) repeat protein/thiol-disulfide isomerase/thioredoxin